MTGTLAPLLALLLLAQQMQCVPLSGKKRTDLIDHGIGVVSFKMDRPGFQPPVWSVEVSDDGTGRYTEPPAGPDTSPSPAFNLHIGAETWKRVSAGYATVSDGSCETKLKNIAKTGAKHIGYRGKTGDIWSQCDFNYSDSADLNATASAFEAIAETLQTGVRLKHKHRFDHLGLDAELDALAAAVKSGYAIELQNIAPILQSIADDDEMMSPARRKATSLLTMAVAQPAVSAR